jgi:hypothetical protein
MNTKVLVSLRPTAVLGTLFGMNFTASWCILIHYIYNGPTNAFVCIKTLIQMSHTKTFKITSPCFDNQMIIIRELSDPG